MNEIAPPDPPQSVPLSQPSPTQADAEAAVRTLIRWAGDDPDREGLLDTPARVARSYLEFFHGYSEDPVAILERTFEEVDGYDEIVLLRDIRLESHCEHHMVPIIGRAHVAYLPHRRVVGISKLARVVDAYARRLQIQEKLTAQIANTIQDVLQPLGTRRDYRGRARVHDDARRAQDRRLHGHQPHARRVPRRPLHAPGAAGDDRPARAWRDGGLGRADRSAIRELSAARPQNRAGCRMPAAPA